MFVSYQQRLLRDQTSEIRFVCTCPTKVADVGFCDIFATCETDPKKEIDLTIGPPTGLLPLLAPRTQPLRRFECLRLEGW